WGSSRGSRYGCSPFRPNGHDLRQVTHLDAHTGIPDWSPDGRRIAFSIVYTDRDLHCGLATMNADGSGVVDLTKAGGPCEQTPSFTPDGNRIFFNRFDGTGDSLWSMDLNGGHRKQILPDGVFPAVSPDARELAFIESSDAGATLIVANPDASGQH